MSHATAQARIKAAVWQAIAKGKIDLSDVSKEKLDDLVDLVTQAALLELDSDLRASIAQVRQEAQAAVADSAAAGVKVPNPYDDVEEILWEGSPFLSLTTTYVITDERVRVIEGLFGKMRQDIELVRIQQMDQRQTASERMFNLGDITIRSADTKNPLIILNNVKDPEQVHEILRRAVLKAREKHNLSYREEM